MSFLADCLAALPPGGVGSVTCIGSGRADLTDASLPEGIKLLLIDGDEHVVSALEGQLQGVEGMKALHAVLTPRGAGVLWNRYNLPILDGPVAFLGWRHRFPRLQQTAQLMVTSRGVAEVLTAEQSWMFANTDAARLNVLILDVPGQESALLEALPDSVLHRFGAVFIRGIRDVAPRGEWRSANEAMSLLSGRGFLPAGGSTQGDQASEAWAVLRFDLDVRSLRIKTLEQQLERSAAELDAAHQALAAQVQVREAVEAEMRALRHDLEASHTEAQAALDSLSRRVAEREAVLQAQIESLRVERDEATHWHTENKRWAESLVQIRERLEREVAALRSEVQSVTAARDEALGREALGESALEVRQAQLDDAQRVLASIEGELSQRTAEAEQLLQRIASLTQERDEAIHWRDENKRWAEQLVAEKRALEEDAVALRTQLEAAVAAHARQLELLSLQADEARRAEARAQEEKGALTAINADLMARGADLESALRAAESSRAQSDSDWQAKLDAADARADAAGVMAHSVRTELGSVREALAIAASGQEELRVRLGVADEQLAKALADVESFKRDALQASDRIEALVVERDNLLARVADLEAAQKAAASAQVDSDRAAQVKLDAAEQRADRTGVALEVAGRENAALKAELERLGTDLESARAAADGAEQSLEGMRRELQNLTAQRAASDEAWQAKFDALRKERDQEAHWHAEHKKWATSLNAEREKLVSALAQAKTDLERAGDARDHEAHWHAEYRRMAQALKASNEACEQAVAEAVQGRVSAQQERDGVLEELTKLKAALADREARQRLIDTEVLRAEAQLELIKDVLIREKNF